MYFKPHINWVLLFILSQINVSTSYAVDASTQTDTEISYDEICGSVVLPDSNGLQSNQNKVERVRSTCELAHALMNQYSLIEQKQKRIQDKNGGQFDSKKHLRECVQNESQIEDPSDLLFIDRLRECVAGFQDTHLSVRARNPIPPVFTGIQIAEVQGRYVIQGKTPELIEYLKTTVPSKSVDFDEAFAIGNEVLKIDGKSPAELSAHYARYLSSSSPEATKVRADSAIFQRDFDYPTLPAAEVLIRSHKKGHHLNLPWWASSEAHSRKDALDYFKRIGIPLTDRVKVLKLDQKTNHVSDVKLSYSGYTDEDSIFTLDPFSPFVTYKTQTGEVAARMGRAASNGYGVCYLQLLTFSPTKLFLDSSKDKVGTDYLEVVRRFIKSCKDQKLDLIFDLRYNHGGNGSYPARILSMLTPPKTSFAGKVVAFRNTSANYRMLESVSKHPELTIGDLDDFGYRQFHHLEQAHTNGKTMTPVIPWENIFPDPKIGGYEGKIVLLITPHCVSACDGMAALLKRNHRATLIGSITNGTGAGFVGSANIDSEFQDSNNQFTARIPNYLFGYSDHRLPPGIELDFYEYEERFFTENRPTRADIPFELTLDDIQGKRFGWLEIAFSTLLSI